MLPAAPGPLVNDITVDVVVVGAGIAGMSVAYELVSQGVEVIVLDDGPVGGGETSRTTAHLVTALDGRYYQLEKLVGRDGAQVCAATHASAVARIGAICADEGIACDFLRVDGFLVVPPEDRDHADELIERERAAAGRAGVGVEVVRRAPFPALDSGPCLRFPNQAQFHPAKYLAGLTRAITRLGGRIHTGTHVKTVHDGDRPSVVTDRGHTVSASAVVVATNTPVNDRLTMHTKQTAYRSYVIGVRTLRGVLTPALIWDGFWDDMTRPYHYTRPRLDAAEPDELLIVGGEDHATGRDEGDPEARYRALEAWTRERFPGALDVAYRWSGQIMEPHDEAAFIGRNPGDKNVYVVTGDSGNGMTHAVIAGLMLPALIRGAVHPWEHTYSPSRLPRHALGRAATKTAHMAAQYRDWIALPEHVAVEQLAPGAGTVVRDNLGRPRAVYRGATGDLHWMSAVCPHLQGVVRWNAGEHCWDCPCHGSSFRCTGEVTHGPANENLKRIEPVQPTERVAPVRAWEA